MKFTQHNQYEWVVVLSIFMAIILLISLVIVIMQPLPSAQFQTSLMYTREIPPSPSSHLASYTR